MKIKRGTMVAAISAATGAVIGLTAAWLGMEPANAAQFGGAISAGTGDILRQLLVALEERPSDVGSAGQTAPSDLVSETAPEEVADKKVAQAASTDSVISTSTASSTSKAEPLRKHPRHHKLERGARQFVRRARQREADPKKGD